MNIENYDIASHSFWFSRGNILVRHDHMEYERVAALPESYTAVSCYKLNLGPIII